MSNKIETTAIVPAVTWETVRSGLITVQSLGKTYLLGKAWLGWQLSVLKAQSNCHHGGNRKLLRDQVADSATWSEIVERETGLKRRPADELIRLWEAALAKHKRLRGPVGNRALLTYLETTDPLSQPADTATIEDFRELFSSICDGESAANLMQELGVIPKPKPMPKATPGRGASDTQDTAGQLAFHFFEATISPLINSLSNPDYKKLLHALPLTSTEDHPLSLATLKTTYRAALADVEEAEKAAAKPAKGRVINA